MKLRLAPLIAALLVTAPSGSASAAGGDPNMGPHSGNVGDHFLVDSRENPGARCIYRLDGTLKSIRVDPPIAYAYDRTPATDVQFVGWRAILEEYGVTSTAGVYTDWTDVLKSRWTKLQASDKHNAAWTRPRTLKLPLDASTLGSYRATIEFNFYQPGSSTHSDGTAFHVVDSYDSVNGTEQQHQYCAAQVEPSPSGTDLHQSGFVGRHVLWDNLEYPGGSCIYRTGGSQQLRRIRVHAPIVFADDVSPERDTQVVGWKFQVQGLPVTGTAGFPWDVVYNSPIFKANATDAYNAQWTGQSWKRVDPVNHTRYRLTVTLLWYDPSGARTGKAIKFVYYYRDVTGPTSVRADYCGNGTS